MNRIAARLFRRQTFRRVSPVVGAFSLGAALSLAATTNAAMLNELRMNAPGSETPSEFIELIGTPGESLDGLTFVGIGDDGANVGTVENLIDLTGQVIPADGYFVIAGPNFGMASDLGFDASVVDFFGLSTQLENNDVISYLLVEGYDATNFPLDADLDVGDDGTLDSTPWTSIVDGFGLLDDTPGDPDYTGQLGIPALGPDGSFTPAHVYRAPDGGDWQIGFFSSADAIDTPGAANPIPEPTTVGLLVAGLTGLGSRRR